MQVLQSSNLLLANLLLVKALPGTLYSLVAYNDKASAQYVQVFNTPGVPASETPVIVFKIAAGATQVLTFQRIGVTFDRGIFIANSSTAIAYTAGGADCFFFVQYI